MSFNFQAIIDSSPESIVIFDINGFIIYTNAAAQEMLGPKYNEVTTNICSIDPTYYGEAGVLNLGLVDAGKLKCYSTLLWKPGGGKLYADASIHRIDGHYVVSYKDTTGKVAFLENTAASALRTEVALNSVPDPIYVIDHKGRWQHANEAALKRFDIDPRDVQAGITSEVIAANSPHLKEFFTHEQKYAENAWRSGVKGMTMARVPASGVKSVEIYQQFYVPNFDREGQPWLLLVYSKNITAVAEAQAVSDERAELLASILSNNSIGLAHCEAGKFVFLNRIFQKYMLESAENFFLLDRSELTFSRRILDYVDSLSDVQPEPEVWDYYSKDGEQRLLKLEFTRRQTFQGKSLGTTVLLTDVTEFMRLESEQSLQIIRLHHLAEKIQNVQEEERQHLANEVHDVIGGTTTAVNLRLGHLEMQLNSGEYDDAKFNLQECLSLTGMLVHKIRGIVKGLEDILPQDADPKEVLQMYAGRYCGMYRLVPSFNLQPGEWKVDQTILNLLLKIMREAINNAGKHSNCSEIRISAGASHSGHFIEISDNGKGMTLEQEVEGNGITQMRRSVIKADGTFRIVSNHSGTTIICNIPSGDSK